MAHTINLRNYTLDPGFISKQDRVRHHLVGRKIKRSDHIPTEDEEKPREKVRKLDFSRLKAMAIDTKSENPVPKNYKVEQQGIHFSDTD